MKMNADEGKKEIRFLGDLQRISPQPGDVFVLATDRDLPCAQLEQIMAQWNKAMPGYKVIVFTGGMRVGAIGGNSGWTKKPPSEDGLYWLKMDGDKPTVANVYDCHEKDKDFGPMVSLIGTDWDKPVHELTSKYACEWFGPIAPPRYS